MLFKKRKYYPNNMATSNEPTGMFDNFQINQTEQQPLPTEQQNDIRFVENEFARPNASQGSEINNSNFQENLTPTQTFEQWQPTKRDAKDLLAKHMTREKMMQANVSIKPETSYNKSNLKEFTVSDIEDLREVNSWLKEGKVAIVDLRSTPSEELGRIVDVVTGMLLALDGSQKKLVKRVFLLSGSDINIEPYFIKLNEKIERVLNK